MEISKTETNFKLQLKHYTASLNWYNWIINEMEDQKLHDIFLTNPIDLLKYVERFVKVTLGNGEIIFGTVYTIDPVSQSLVLIYKEISNEVSLKIILKHAINSMEMLPEVPIDQQNITDNIFNSCECLSSKTNVKEDVKNWLVKNMIPVVESGDKLVIDSVEIHPPYTAFQCYSDNSVVLSRIQKLLEQMPPKES